MISTPPVGHFGNGKVHYTTVTAPRPGHIIASSCGGVFHKITEAVGFFPLLPVGLGDDRVLRNDDFKAHLFEVGKHFLRVLIVLFPPVEVLQVLGPANVLIDNVARNAPFAVSFGYFIRKFLGSQQTTALCKT